MREQQVFWSRGIRNFLAVEPLSLVPDSDRDFSVHVAPAVDVDTLVRVLPVTVDYGIRKSLTEREQEVLRGIFEGLTNRTIGAQIGVSEGSVKATVQQLFQKTRVRTRSQLVRAALEGAIGAPRK